MAETNAYSDRHPEPTKENEKEKRELSLCLHAFPFSFLHSCILGLKASLSPPYGSCDFCVSRFQDTNGSGGRGSGWPRILFYLLLLLGPEVEETLKDPHLEEEGGRSNGGKQCSHGGHCGRRGRAPPRPPFTATCLFYF